MALKFGTSGVRGLVTEMTDLECYLYTKAFIQYLKTMTDFDSLSIAGDLRKSTPAIIKAVIFAIEEEGIAVDNCGGIPTGAVTYWGMQNKRPSIMVTGSHIPDDRNGIKFNMPWGEILKDDEAQISKKYKTLKKTFNTSVPNTLFDERGYFKASIRISPSEINGNAEKAYINRYINYFPAHCLNGLKVVLYQHSSVGRDILATILENLGAEVVTVGRSDIFIPVDTEAVKEEEQLAAWVKEHKAHALLSADGDTDRPLVVNEKGSVIRGDVLGILVSRYLKADSVSAPVSCNTALEKCGNFRHISRTKIGSPYVISAMKEAAEKKPGTVVGYEANGGYLTASDMINAEGKILKALPTRDAVLPIIAVLLLSQQEGKSLSRLVAELPPRFTVSGLLSPFAVETSKEIIKDLTENKEKSIDKFFRADFGKARSFDFTDGVRITFTDGNIVHLRPSGNAPELRCYTESSTEKEAKENNEKALHIVRDGITPALERNNR